MNTVRGVYRGVFESTAFSILAGTLIFQSVDKSRVEQLLKTADQAILNNEQARDEEASRLALAAIMTQTGLNALDIPELATLLSPSKALNAIVTIERRKNVMAAIPLDLPAQGWFASGFGKRVDPITGRKTDHKGLDISNNPGTPIYAPADGFIRFASTYGRFGNYISMVHGYGILTKYAHLQDIMVKKGQYVKKGEMIGRMGASGKSTGVHLHYEIWINDHAFNPYAFLPKAMKHERRSEPGTPSYMLLAGQP